MKFVNCTHQGQRFLGVLDEEAGKVTRVDHDGRAGDALLDLIRAEARGEGGAVLREGESVSLSEVQVLAPLPRPPRNIICVGKNYHEHADEFARSGFDASSAGADAIPTHPIFFTKPATAVIGPEMPIDPHTALTSALDYEAEIAVILGRGGRNIAPAAAWEHVWGLTLVNDVTARDLQQRHKQWFLGKSLDTFCPMGPWAVTLDEVDVAALKLQSHVNGELRQEAQFADLIFDVPTLISTLSAGITLEPGDIIATGTPAGVGIGFEPPRFLKPGDVVSVTATGLGTLTNPVGA